MAFAREIEIYFVAEDLLGTSSVNDLSASSEIR
jgi:hypothetical protein